MVARSKSFRTKTLRLHPLENSIIDRALEALNGMERTQLVQEAVISEASRLGIRWTREPPEPLKVPWPYLPDRGEREAAVARMIDQGYSPAPSYNPYWDAKGRTFEDPDT